MVYTNILSHPKTGRLVDALGLKSPGVEPEVIAAGMLVSLWTWAAQNAYHGDLSDCSDRVIAQACRWKKDPQKLVQALQECGWLDGKILHDWEEYAELYISQQENAREKTRERVRNYRARKKTETLRADDIRPYESDDVTPRNGYGNVTETPCNASTIHNHTIPEPNITNTSILSEKERKEKKKESVPSAAEENVAIDWSGFQLTHPGGKPLSPEEQKSLSWLIGE